MDVKTRGIDKRVFEASTKKTKPTVSLGEQ